jgi:hypothetical protein
MAVVYEAEDLKFGRHAVLNFVLGQGRRSFQKRVLSSWVPRCHDSWAAG